MAFIRDELLWEFFIDRYQPRMIDERYAPDVPFPSYSYVPGRNPHPISDSRGHSFGKSHIVPKPMDPNCPRGSKEFLVAVDLFNAGYCWEAHETWEGLWIAAGRSGTVADFLKGLIKLAAAGVKALEGNPVGVERHARRAAELFQSVRHFARPDDGWYSGLNVDELIREANSLSTNAIVDDSLYVSRLPIISLRLTFEKEISPQ